METILQNAIQYSRDIDIYELLGLIFGLLAVILLIKENILTWPAGILYCFISLYIFLEAKLYQDFGLTIFFLVMNIYGWYSWRKPKDILADKLSITKTDLNSWLVLSLIAVVYILSTGYLFNRFTDASLPYADATTTGLSLIAMWMTAKKKLENWILWFVVDILATIVYVIKGIDFYALLYFIYIGLAVIGYLNWRKLYHQQELQE